jgi:hypothetical protein
MSTSDDSKLKGKSIIVRLYNFPVIHGAVGLILTAYLYVKAFNPLFTKGLNMAETVANKYLQIGTQLFQSQSKCEVRCTWADE